MVSLRKLCVKTNRPCLECSQDEVLHQQRSGRMIDVHERLRAKNQNQVSEQVPIKWKLVANVSINIDVGNDSRLYLILFPTWP